jgi:hypothetical protein
MQGTSGHSREVSAGMRAEPMDEKIQDQNIQPSEDDFIAYFMQKVQEWKAKKK